MSINFSAFEIGRRALNANQLGINVTSNNIANVNTPGYARQQVQLAESAPLSFSGYQVGTGVSVEGLQSYRDRFIESRLQTETGISGKLTARRDTLSAVENTLQGSETSGLQNALNKFFGAFRDLEANPNSVPLRAITVQRGTALANSFQTTRSQLEQIRSSADGQIRATVDETNSLSQRIATLNGQIRNIESGGGQASVLRDQRGELLNKISELTGSRSVENEDGTVTVTIGEGRALVIGDKANSISVQSVPPDGLSALTINNQPAIFEEGQIRGLQEAIAATTAQIGNLDDLAAEIAQRVNALHTSGTDLDGNAGVNFFDTSQPVTAKNISINPALVANSRLVVASPLAQPAEGGTVAGSIANLLTDTNSTVGTKTGSFSTIFSSMLSEVGEQVRQTDDALQTHNAIVSQIVTQREAISGVSLDEEAINLLRYQKAFEAAARFIKVADEMTQTILSLAQ